MSNYVLENDRESARLEKMSRISAYQPSEEVTKITFKQGQKVLDAGCGSGLVARYIADHYPGVSVEACDLSPVRIEQAKEIRGKEGKQDIRFFVSRLESIDAPDCTYDRVTCRYVFEFLSDPMKVLSEFQRVLKPGGQLLVIQFDGFIFNYFHRNSELDGMLGIIRKELQMDMFLGRRIPSLMMDAGFIGVDWDVKAYGFKGEELEGEREQMWERLDFAMPALENVLGSREKAEKFRDIYCREMVKPGSVIFYNKFLVSGAKP